MAQLTKRVKSGGSLQTTVKPASGELVMEAAIILSAVGVVAKFEIIEL